MTKESRPLFEQMKKHVLTICRGEKRAKEQRESYVFGNKSSYIHLVNVNASLSEARVKYSLCSLAISVSV